MLCDPSCTGDHTRPRGAVYAVTNAIVVTDSDDVIDAACRARRMWNDRHPNTVMPEGIYDPATSCVWFPRPGHTALRHPPTRTVRLPMSGTCVDCQTFLAVGETRYCGACFPVKAQRCRGCRIQFEPDGDMFCKACRATPFLWEPT